jgi:rhamnosyltransferase subunit B
MHEPKHNYIVICVGTTGDIHPFMHIANTLKVMGRRVTFITNTYHAKLVEDCGLEFLGLGTERVSRILCKRRLS